MSRLCRLARTLALIWPCSVAAPLAAQQETDTTAADSLVRNAGDTLPQTGGDTLPKNGADSAERRDSAAAPEPAAPSPTPVNHLQTALAGFKLSGYAEASYSYSTEAAGSAIVGRLYDRYQDQFALNAVKIVLDKPYAADKFDAGFRADVLFGQNAALLKSNGLNLGDNGDVTQLFVTLNIPTPNGNGVQLKAGKMVTLMGVEVIESVANPNWSEGSQFIYVENFTALGVSAEYKFNKYVDAQLRLINGWDVVQDNNTKKSFMGRLGVYPDDLTSVGLVGYYGPEEPDDASAKRYGGNVVVNRKLGRSSVWVQGDYGREDANAALPDPTRDATWWALGGWVTYDLAPTLGLALRADYLDDREGARTAAAFGLTGGPEHELWSGTATLNVKSWQNLLLRPEVRYDHSNLTPFDGKKDQVTFSLSAAYIY